MSKRNSFRPSLERLDDRALMSVTGPVAGTITITGGDGADTVKSSGSSTWWPPTAQRSTVELSFSSPKSS